MMKTIYCIVYMLISIYTIAQKHQPARTAHIQVITEPTSIDSFELRYWPELLDTRGASLQNRILQQEIGSDCSFMLNIPKDKQAVYFTLLQNKKKYLINTWFAESGDSVTIQVKNKRLYFSGPGSAKYQYRYFMDSLFRDWQDRKDSLPETLPVGIAKQYGYPTSVFNGLMKWQKKTKLAMEELKKTESRLTPWAYQVLQAETLGYRQQQILYGLTVYYIIEYPKAFPKQVKDSLIMEIVNIYKRYRSVLSHIDSAALAFSVYYSSWLTDEAERASVLYQTSGLNWILQNFNGRLKDQLLTALLLRRHKEFEPEQLNTFDSSIKDPHYRAIATKTIAHQTIGDPLFPFRLTALNGKIITPEDVKGKVLLMDFWFTGCTECVAMTPILARVRNALADDSSFAFISISIDQDAGKWKKSIQSGLYTSEGFLHTYTNGNGFTDPLIQYYGIDGAPTILIFDSKGRFYSSRRPIFKDTQPFEDYIRHLKEAVRN